MDVDMHEFLMGSDAPHPSAVRRLDQAVSLDGAVYCDVCRRASSLFRRDVGRPGLPPNTEVVRPASTSTPYVHRPSEGSPHGLHYTQQSRLNIAYPAPATARKFSDREVLAEEAAQGLPFLAFSRRLRQASRLRAWAQTSLSRLIRQTSRSNP